jgi:phycocyanobilin lyase alpha subunit
LNAINSPQSAIKALENEDAGIRYHAAWWLGKNRVESAVPMLIECLKDDKDQTSAGGFPLRRQAARSLGLINDISCTPYLLETFQTNDVQLHEASIRALIEINSPTCIYTLINYLDKNIKEKPMEALIEALTAYEAWGINKKIEPFLTSSSERIASAAAAYFYKYTGEIYYLNKIHRYLEHDNRFIRQSATFDLAKIGSIASTKSILKAEIPNNIKMYSLKVILNKTLSHQAVNHDQDLCRLNNEQREIIIKIDSLVRENFEGTLSIKDDCSNDNEIKYNSAAHDNLKYSDVLHLLRSRSLSDRNLGIALLAKNRNFNKLNLSDFYFSETDQDIRMGLIKAITLKKDSQSEAALIDAVGVEIGNHCEGNIRRVAACALGSAALSLHQDERNIQTILDKLSWALVEPDDWGLRYSSCLALEEINESRAINILSQACQFEPDSIVNLRMQIALSTEFCLNSP